MDLENVFDSVLRNVMERPLRKKVVQEVLVRSAMTLHEAALTRVRVDSLLSEKFEVNVRIYQGSMLSSFLFALVVDVVTEFARWCAK